MFQRSLRQTTWQMGGNTVAILGTAPLPYLVITVKVKSEKKVSFSDIQNRNATDSVAINAQTKTFSKIFVELSKSILNFKYFSKKGNLHS